MKIAQVPTARLCLSKLHSACHHLTLYMFALSLHLYGVFLRPRQDHLYGQLSHRAAPRLLRTGSRIVGHLWVLQKEAGGSASHHDSVSWFTLKELSPNWVVPKMANIHYMDDCLSGQKSDRHIILLATVYSLSKSKDHNNEMDMGVQNEAGKRLTAFCQEDTLVRTSTLFQQHKRQLYTWTWPDDQYKNRIDYILCSQRWRSSIQSSKTRPGADYGSDHELLIAKFRLKLKKVEKTTRPFRYDLNQPPYDYTVEVTNRFKGLDLIECLKCYRLKFVTLYRRLWPRPSSRKRNAKKAKWLC